jgi:hypothetical protein
MGEIRKRLINRRKSEEKERKEGKRKGHSVDRGRNVKRRSKRQSR